MAYYIPEEIRGELGRTIRFEDDYRIFELSISGGKPEDAWIISRVRIHSVTGEVEVEVVGLQKRMEIDIPDIERGKGCAECRRRVYTELWPPPIHIAMAEDLISLHRRYRCGTYWEVSPQGGHTIREEDAREKFPEAFTKQE